MSSLWFQAGAILLTALHVVGGVSAVHAALSTRTPQGAIAWALGLVMLPYVALPLYWILGPYRYRGYVDARRRGNLAIHEVARQLGEHAQRFDAKLPAERVGLRVMERLASMPFTAGNRSKLLIDGEVAFQSLREGIKAAKDYALVQFFIWRNDELGRDLRDKLAECARAGKRVYVLYDPIGSHGVRRGFFKPLVQAGGKVRAFRTRRLRNRFQINFRNHRKVAVVDGRKAWVGGLNVGIEYLGQDKRRGAWRDTHVELEGPAVQGVQLSFLEDWFYSTGEVPEWEWEPKQAEGGELSVLALPTGPADMLETCGLAFVEAIHEARKRVWITSPYFVPDHAVVSALQLAALEGVDVRILLPERPDHLLVWLSSFSYYDDVLPVGVKLYRYGAGFLHQKVMLVDDEVASVSTANLDNRSFRLNFEIALIHVGRSFAKEVEAMLQRDFARSRLVTREDLTRRNVAFRMATRLARLLAPIQ